MNTQHMELISQLMELAVTSRDKLHIHVSYAPHIDAVDVGVLRASTDYQNRSVSDRLYDKTVYLDWDHYDPTEELQNMLTDLTELVGRAS